MAELVEGKGPGAGSLAKAELARTTHRPRSRSERSRVLAGPKLDKESSSRPGRSSRRNRRAMREVDAHVVEIRRSGQNPDQIKATIRASLKSVEAIDVEAIHRQALASVDHKAIEASVAAAENVGRACPGGNRSARGAVRGRRSITLQVRRATRGAPDRKKPANGGWFAGNASVIAPNPSRPTIKLEAAHGMSLALTGRPLPGGGGGRPIPSMQRIRYGHRHGHGTKSF